MGNMGVESIKNNINNPQRVYLWEIVIPSILGGGSAKDLEVRAQSTVYPGRSFGDIKIPYKATPGFNIPGKLVMPQLWPCRFIESTDRKTFDAIYGWKQSIVGAETGIGFPDVLLKRNLYLRLLNWEGSETNRIKMVGTYPHLMDDTPLNYEDENAIYFSVTFKYDFWVQDV